MNRRNWSLMLLLLVAVSAGTVVVWMAEAPVFAQESETPETAETPAADAPSAEGVNEEQSALERQRAVAARYKRFDKTLLKMAEYLRKTDPERAELLVRAIRISREQRIADQMDSVVDLLEGQQFGPALERQDDVLGEMVALLKLLQSENRHAAIAAEKARIKDLLKDLGKILDKEKHLRSQTERGEDADRLAKKQGDVAGETRQLANKIDQQDAEKAAQNGEPGEGKPGEGKPGEGKPGEGKPGEGKPGEGKPGEGKPGEGKPGEGKPGEGKPGEGKPGEGKPGEGKPGEGKPGEGKPGEGKPGEGKPGEGKPGEGKPGEGKPGEGKPGQGKPGQGKPGQGKPGESQPGEQDPNQNQDQQPQDNRTPGRQEIEQSIEEMERAIEELRKKNRDGASKAQDEAIKKLIAAKEKLEEILRQLREEEREMLLAALEARFLKMLAMQKLVYQGTVGLGNVPAEDWEDSRHATEARKLAGDENQIALDAAKALELLKAEGSSVAFPEAVEQLREDMLTVARRLNEAKVGELTQAIEKDIIEALGEILEALKKEMEKLKEQKKNPPPKEGRPSDPPLVDQLAELKMLRSLQLRVNRMTRRLGRMVQSEDGEQADDPEIVEQLQTLGRRQGRIQQATYDLATGRNK